MNEFVWGPASLEECERDAIASEGSINDDRPSGIYPIVSSFDDFSATGSDDDVPF